MGAGADPDAQPPMLSSAAKVIAAVSVSASAAVSAATDAAMPRFRYHARESVTGQRRSGEMAAESAYAVRAALRRIGLQAEEVIPLLEQPMPVWAEPLVTAWHAHLRRRRQAATADLCDAIATLLTAGVTLDEALASISSSITRTPGERSLASRLREVIRNGQPFSDACAAEPSWFDRFDVALFSAGQRAGDLAATLLAAAQHHQRSGSIGQRLFVALAYPAILLLAGIGVVEFMSFKILPQLSTLLLQAHQTVPPLTRLFIEGGHVLALWWPLLLGGIGFSIWGIGRIIERIPPTGKFGLLVHGNLLSRLRRRYRAARFAWSLARLLGAGMTITEALAVVAQTLHDRPLRRLVNECLAAITTGQDFSTVLARSPLLDPEVAQLIQIGERSGELVRMLEHVAERSFRSADRTLERLTALIGPLAIVFLAIIIGTVVLACILPISHLGDVL